MTGMSLPDPLVDPCAETVCRVLETPYPYGAAHLSTGPDDVDVTPERLHPAFHGSYDWHSSVHMQWSALRLLDRASAPWRTRLSSVLQDRLTTDALATEAGYLRAHPGFERPYGLAWLLMLAAAARRHGDPAWRAALTEAATVAADGFVTWLPRLARPVRHGVHANTAFALSLCLTAAHDLDRADLSALVAERARAWFLPDRDAPVAYEPSGEDFLSPSLTEADLLRRVLPTDEFADWLTGFLPGLGHEDDPLLEVPTVTDRTDGRGVHLFGLALSRAGQLRRLAPHLDAPAAARVRTRADAMEQAVVPEILGGDFVATHWLVSFALLAHDG